MYLTECFTSLILLFDAVHWCGTDTIFSNASRNDNWCMYTIALPSLHHTRYAFATVVKIFDTIQQRYGGSTAEAGPIPSRQRASGRRPLDFRQLDVLHRSYARDERDVEAVRASPTTELYA